MKLKIHKHRGEYVVSLVSALPIGEHLFSGQISRSEEEDRALANAMDAGHQLIKYGTAIALECLRRLSGDPTKGCWDDEEQNDNS